MNVMINGFEIKKIVVSFNEGQPSAVASVEFVMESAKPNIEELKDALIKWILSLKGQRTL